MNERDRLSRLAEDGDLDAADALLRVLEREGDTHALEHLRERLARDGAEATRAYLGAVSLHNARLSCRFVGYAEGLGLILALSIYTFDPAYQATNGELLMLPPEQLARWPQALERLTQRIDAITRGGPRALDQVFSGTASDAFGFPTIEAPPTPPSEVARARHTAQLATSRETFPLIAEQFQRIYGMRLPRHIAVGHALLQSLTPYERYGLSYLGRSASGVLLAFEHEQGLERPKVVDRIDARIDYRFRCDPPEMVTVLHGDSDGLHYGLWYDHPADLPSGLVANYARDSAETYHTGATTIRELLLNEIRERLDEMDDPGAPVHALAALNAVVEAFADADRDALEADGPLPWRDAERFPWNGGLSSALPAGSGDPRGSYAEARERYELYRSGDMERLNAMVETARAELEAGQPAYALVIGRELHWFDDDDTRALSTELLTAAYEALGRHALAEIVRVHHQNRDIRSVAIFARSRS